MQIKMILIKKLFKNIYEEKGFGLVDAILSITLLAGIISYGIYFSSLRLNTVYYSNLIRSINKEVERDLERLKRDLWGLNYDKNSGKYLIYDSNCNDFIEDMVGLPSWQTDLNSAGQLSQSWRPGPERSKVFSGMKVLITRQLDFMKPANTNESLNNSIANINYRVQWGENDKHWLSIDLVPEYHSWCEQKI